MGRPKVVDVDYYQFRDKLKRATDAGGRIERKDRDRWRQYVQQHGFSETALEAWGKIKFVLGKTKLVAIDHGSDWDGVYAYSEEDEACMKWEREPD